MKYQHARVSLFAAAVTLTSVAPFASADLVLRYKFDEGSGSSTRDFGTGLPANGTLSGAAWTTDTPGGFGKALDLTGASAADLKYVTGPDGDKLDGLSQFTLSTWVNVQDNPSGNRRLLSKQAASADGFTWNISDPGSGVTRSASAFSTRLFIGGTNGFLFDPVPTPANNPTFVIDADHKWVFLAVTYDGTLDHDNATYYMGTTTAPLTVLAVTTIGVAGVLAGGTTNPSDALFGVGYTDAAPGSNLTLPGYMDDARVYNTVLTAPQLELIRAANLVLPHITGDTDKDGDVDLDDLNNVLNNFGDQTPGNVGDENGDNSVDLTDLNDVLNNFGSQAAPVALSTIPEPSSLLLLTTGCWLLTTPGLRRRRP